MRLFNLETVPSFPYCCSGKDNISMRKTHIYITMKKCQATWERSWKVKLCVYVTTLLVYIMIYYCFY